ncbi:PIN domain-containing protein [uncultured Treponema sp.]|uniref:type II toxin-antitoxin system VapC family toxin n=1 Tax=uncultured Treponema sp. TaxID=162155 RepID=UPI0025F5B83C|nr:PIN domain-containing protein [uncultured Treponema sp.]
MKVLIDTNILLDVILLREPHFELSKRVLQCCQSIVDGYIAVHTFSNMFYVLHETEDFSIEDCRNTFNKLLYVFDVASLDKSDVIAAVNNETFDDLEDSMQHQSSIACKLDYSVTRNVDDFEKATIPAVTPKEFLRLVHAEK